MGEGMCLAISLLHHRKMVGMGVHSQASPLLLQAPRPDYSALRCSRSALLASPVGSNTCFWCRRKFSGPGAVLHPVRSPAFFPHTQSPQYKRLSHAGAGSGSLQVVFPGSHPKADAQHRSCRYAAALLSQLLLEESFSCPASKPALLFLLPPRRGKAGMGVNL
jgi:hypothetical protein